MKRDPGLSCTLVSAAGKHTDMTRTESSSTPLILAPTTTTRATHITPRIHPLPPTELWGRDICGERLVWKQCAFQFTSRSLQRQTRLWSLPQRLSPSTFYILSTCQSFSTLISDAIKDEMRGEGEIKRNNKHEGHLKATLKNKFIRDLENCCHPSTMFF